MPPKPFDGLLVRLRNTPQKPIVIEAQFSDNKALWLTVPITRLRSALKVRALIAKAKFMPFLEFVGEPNSKPKKATKVWLDGKDITENWWSEFWSAIASYVSSCLTKAWPCASHPAFTTMLEGMREVGPVAKALPAYLVGRKEKGAFSTKDQKGSASTSVKVGIMDQGIGDRFGLRHTLFLAAILHHTDGVTTRIPYLDVNLCATL